MILDYSSIESVIAKIVRDTGLERSDIIGDVIEWIGEAMDNMNLQIELAPYSKELKLNFHAAKIPCGMVRILAVSYQGFRLRYRNRDNDPRVKTRVMGSSTTAGNPNSTFYTDPMVVEYNPVQGKTRPWPYPRAVADQPFHEEAYYQVKGGHVWTSFPKGSITVHGERAPMDENDLPMVPNNMAFKEAVYYHVRIKMVGSGKFVDPAFTMRDLIGLYDTYASKALEEITYPTPDQMESMIDTWVRLIPSSGFFKNFSDPIGPEPFYDTYGETRPVWHDM